MVLAANKGSEVEEQTNIEAEAEHAEEEESDGCEEKTRERQYLRVVK
jgi:hypothetical protein